MSPAASSPDAAGLQRRLVVFDLGRVLVRICDDWHHACRLAGAESLPERLTDAQEAAMHAAVVEHETGRMDLARFAAAGAAAVGLTAATLTAISDVYVLGPYDGAVELLDELATAGVATACLSNINDNHWRIVYDRSLPGFFPLEKFRYRFASHRIGARKPEDAIYAHVEAATGVAGREITFFDDMPINVAAARRRGWDAHVITDRKDPVSQVRSILGLRPR